MGIKSLLNKIRDILYRDRFEKGMKSFVDQILYNNVIKEALKKSEEQIKSWNETIIV